MVLRALTALTLIAFVIILAVGLAPFFIPVKPDRAPVSKVFLPAAVAAVQAFLLTPSLIAVHRFIIPGEVTANYRLAPGDQRFQRFVGWSLALLAMFWTAGLLNNRVISLEMSPPIIILTIAAVVAI